MLSEQTDHLELENQYTGSTRNVILNVLLGRADAGATLSPQLDRESEEIRSQIRTILETREVPSHPLSAHPRVPEEIRHQVREAVLALSRRPEGAELMQQVRMPAPVAVDYPSHYQALEKIQIKQLSDWGN